MSIAANPKRSTSAVSDAQAESFISGAGKSNVGDARDDARKPVMVRIPSDLLKRIDQAAKKKSISRSSYIVSSMADLVNGER